MSTRVGEYREIPASSLKAGLTKEDRFPRMRTSAGDEGRDRRIASKKRRMGARFKMKEQEMLCNPEVEVDHTDEVETDFSIEDFDIFIVADPVEDYDLARDEDGRESGAEHDS